MLLSLMTYARFETYRNSQIFQVFFNNYMEKDERGYVNLGAEKQYAATKGSSKDGSGGSQPKVNANRRISLALLASKDKREKQAKDWAQERLLLKNLINVLYNDQPFFQQVIQERPQVVDELINSLVQTIDGLPENKKLKKAEELANLKLGDPLLDLLFYKILHGAPYKEVIKEQPSLLPEQKEEKKGEAEDDDSSVQSESEEFKSTKGYFSLLDFVNVSPTLKIRVYLAPREVLMAIFNDQGIVDEMMLQRKALYKQANADGDLKALSETFQNQFEQRRPQDIDKSMLDFSVTKTNPDN